MSKLAAILLMGSTILVAACNKDKDFDEHSSPLMQTMHTMSTEMGKMQMTNDPDHDFAMMMTQHHQGAINMASYELANGDDATIKNMAQMMKDMQMEESKKLDSFVKAHTPSGNSMDFMNAAMKSMSKMDKDADSQNLKGDSDHDFVHLMIPHHQSAIEMAQAEIEYGKVQMMKDMAQKMIEDQQKEIAELKSWLNAND